MRTKVVCYVLALFLTPLLSGCWLLAVGGAGAYGGYKAKEEGYEIQSPITKKKKDKAN